MSAAPLVSVVIPAYNAAATLRVAVESVYAQGFRDYEVIVVDDASADRTPDVVQQLCSEGRGLRGLRMPANSGPAAARNRGIAAAQGTWLAFLDGDDVWFPWRLETQWQLAAAQPDIALWCGRIVPWGAEAGVPLSGSAGAPAVRPLTLEELAVHNPVATSTVLVRREIVAAAGGFDPQFRGPEDYDLWLRVAATSRVAFIDRPLAQYRHVPGSLSLDDRRFLPQIMRVLDKAYGVGGVLHGRRGARRARGYHCLACSWMAAQRGALGRALGLFLRSLLFWPWPYGGPHNPLPRARVKLLKYFAVRWVRGKSAPPPCTSQGKPTPCPSQEGRGSRKDLPSSEGSGVGSAIRRDDR